MPFVNCTSLKELHIPASVEQIGPNFAAGASLQKVYFYGSPPKGFTESSGGITIISFPPTATLYYIEGTPGWTSPTWIAPDGTVYNTATFKP